MALDEKLKKKIYPAWLKRLPILALNEQNSTKIRKCAKISETKFCKQYQGSLIRICILLWVFNTSQTRKKIEYAFAKTSERRLLPITTIVSIHSFVCFHRKTEFQRVRAHTIYNKIMIIIAKRHERRKLYFTNVGYAWTLKKTNKTDR